MWPQVCPAPSFCWVLPRDEWPGLPSASDHEGWGSGLRVLLCPHGPCALKLPHWRRGHDPQVPAPHWSPHLLWRRILCLSPSPSGLQTSLKTRNHLNQVTSEPFICLLTSSALITAYLLKLMIYSPFFLCHIYKFISVSTPVFNIKTYWIFLLIVFLYPDY